MSDEQDEHIELTVPEEFSLLGWKDGQIGQDWFLRPRDNAPLIRNREMDQFVHLNSDILSDVDFWGYLGHGAFGNVWRVKANLKVRDPNRPNSAPVWTRFTLACKIIHHLWCYIEEIKGSFVEAKMLSYLRHENICNLAEVIGIPDRETNFPYSAVCIFYEICDGNLRQLIEHVRRVRTDPTAVFPETLSRHWFAQIAKALVYIHDNNVGHKDIKETNILYKYGPPSDDNGFFDLFMDSVFKLADFGQATHVTTCKTQADIDNFYDKDLFDLGKVLSFTGILPNNQMYPELLDLLERMESADITAREILVHPWLQKNNEDQTERFIFRTPRATPPYYAWHF